MWRMGLDTIGIGIVSVTLLTLVFAVLVLQRQRSGKTIGIWLGSVLVGLLLGVALTLGAIRLLGTRPLQGILNASTAADQGAPTGPTIPSGGPSGGSGGGPGGPGGGMSGMGAILSGMGGGTGGMGGPNPKRDLTTLVRKLNLLTGDIKITLTAEQSTAMTTALVDIEKTATMTDDDATAKYEALMAVLADDQKSLLETIGLPRPPRAPGGGADGPGVAPGGPGGAAPAADENPFQQDTNVEALESLRRRFVPAATPPAAVESQPATE